MLRMSRFGRAIAPSIALLFGVNCGGDRIGAPAPTSLVAAPPPSARPLLVACPAGATRWVAAVNGSWTDPARWSAGVPTSAVPACIDLPGSYTVTVATLGTFSAQHLFIGAPAAATQPVVRVTSGTLFVVGDATAHGRVELVTSAGVTARFIVSATLGIAPTGIVTTAGAGAKIVEAATIDNEGTITPGSAFPSVSHLTINVGMLINRGTIDVPAGRHLHVQGLSSGGFPQLIFESGTVNVDGFMEQINGKLNVGGGSVVGTVKLIAASDLILTHDGGGRFELWRGPGIVNPLTPLFLTRLLGEIGAGQHVWIGNNHIAVETYGIVNHGQLTVASTAAIGTLAAVLRPAIGQTLTNAADGRITLTGTGSPTLSGSVINEGLIEVTDDAALRPNPLVNRGTFRTPGATVNAIPPSGQPPAVFVNDGGQLDLTSGRYNQTGGRFENLDGTVSTAGLMNLTAVRFSGFGTWARPLALAGAGFLAPGASPGRIAVTGDYSPSTSTFTQIELGGDDPGAGYDQVAVSGTARFAGALSVSLIDGFAPRPCQTFDVVTYGARTNTFSNAATPIDVGGGMKLRQVYTATKLVLVAYSANGPNVSPTEVAVNVDGTTATYEVCIGAGADVITVQPEDQVLVDKTTLTFGASQLPQTVTVSAAPGANRPEAFIRHQAASSTPVATVRVTIVGAQPADTDPPVTTAIATPEPNANGWNDDDVTVQLTASDEGSGVAEVVWSTSGGQSGGATVSGSSTSIMISAEGNTTLTYFARDVAGNQEAPKTLDVYIDRTPPAISCSANPAEIWPPNGQLVPVAIQVTTDGASGFLLEQVSSNEPESAGGDILDFEAGTPDTNGRLRAARLGGGAGRIYTFRYRAFDDAGNSAVGSCEARVPHDQGKRKP